MVCVGSERTCGAGLSDGGAWLLGGGDVVSLDDANLAIVYRLDWM